MMMTQTVTPPADEKPDVARNRTPRSDWTGVDIEDTGTPISSGRGGNRFARLDGTPFEAALVASYETGTAKSVVVNSEVKVREVTYLLRLAAEKIGLGVRIPTPAEEGGKWTVLFQGAKRRESTGPRKPSKQRANESDEEWEARKSAWEQATGETWVAKSH